MGCVEGGLPSCPVLGDLICSDGESMDPNKIMELQIAGQSGKCPCKDGKMAKCKQTGEKPKCPNGDDTDFRIGGLPEWKQCDQS
jgi:hypothetical protein